MLTAEQYLEIERAAEFKSEYYDGQMFGMSGGSIPHSKIGGQIIAALVYALRGKGCSVGTSALKVQVSSTGAMFYPDVTVYCGDPQTADEYQDRLLNPRVVFEVLSKSSEAYDRGHKFDVYRKIESLQEYVLVSQTEPHIEVYLRQPQGKWLLSHYVGLDGVCELQSLDCSMPLSDVYDGIKLSD